LDSSIIQGPFSVAPCQTLVSRFATFPSPYCMCVCMGGVEGVGGGGFWVRVRVRVRVAVLHVRLDRRRGGRGRRRDGQRLRARERGAGRRGRRGANTALAAAQGFLEGAGAEAAARLQAVADECQICRTDFNSKCNLVWNKIENEQTFSCTNPNYINNKSLGINKKGMLIQ
jgi:hypothetical protein